MNRLLIVDGSNLLFQMFFGMPARIVGKDGKAVHGTLGKIIKLGNYAELPFEMRGLIYRDSSLTTNEVLKKIGLR